MTSILDRPTIRLEEAALLLGYTNRELKTEISNGRFAPIIRKGNRDFVLKAVIERELNRRRCGK